MSPKWRRRLRRGLLGTAIAIPVLVISLWIVVHTFPGAGPVLSDTLRWAIGTERVSRLQDFVYGIEDSVNQWWREDEAPKSYWEVPSGSASAVVPPVVPPASGSAETAPALPPFAVPNVGPMFKKMAAKGDGAWVPVVDPGKPKAPTVIFKTLLHPDPKRPWAELFLIAIDLRQIDLHLVAGSAEPVAITAEGRKYTRPAVIPPHHHPALVAAFNGGFKKTHGRWGMHIDKVTLIPPRKHGCTIIKKTDGTLTLYPFMATKDDMAILENGHVLWWRQTPPCMYRAGKRHGGLWDPDSKNWGAALGGDTVIRRSAIGLDKARKILFMSVSNHTAAQIIANGMSHAGAVDVAQLDVNWSFPKVVVFERDGVGTPIGKPLFDGFKVAEGEYVTAKSVRDFFYLVRKEPSQH